MAVYQPVRIGEVARRHTRPAPVLSGRRRRRARHLRFPGLPERLRRRVSL